MPWLKPISGEYIVYLGHIKLPIMIMTYIGTLKAWLYRPILKIFGTGLVAVRLPMLLAGVASVWLFFLLLRRIAGERAAWIGCTILAVDSTYLLTICFDWGPVALQHLLTILGWLLLVRFWQERSHRVLFWAFFVFGLLLWDKALALWMMSGSAVAAFVVFPKQIVGLLTRRRLMIAAAGFLLGCLPLTYYNVRTHFRTFRGNFQLDTADFPTKARMLKETAKGGGLFSWMFYEDWQTSAPHAPSGFAQNLSDRISTIAGHPRRHFLFYAFILALVLAPFARGDALKTIIFALVALLVAWLQMALNRDTGGSVHHTILLWPLPQIVVAVSFTAATRRLGRAGIMALALAGAGMAASGVAVTAEYHYVSYRYGGTPIWTDAVFPLRDYLRTVHSGNIYCIDWDIIDPLRLLGGGKLPIHVGDDPINKPELSPDDRAIVERMVRDPGAIFVTHSKAYTNFPAVNANLLKFAQEIGYHREDITTISDSYGRVAYEIYRLVSD